MAIIFHAEEIAFPDIDKKNTINWIIKIIDHENFKLGNINIIFVSDNYIIKINKQYLSHDYFTDIITFDYCENEIITGDIFISIDRVNENAEKFNSSFLNELNRVIIHGILHLMGFSDNTENEKKEMRKKENLCLNQLKI